MIAFRSRLALLALAAASVACASRRPGPRPVSGRFDRDVEVRAVYASVLREMYVRPGVEQVVIGPDLPALGPAAVDEVAQRLPETRADTRDDFASRRSPARMPVDLDLGVPVRWFGDADWNALPLPVEGSGAGTDDRWREFHRRFPRSSGWIRFSQVGFSRDGTEAVLQAGSSVASLDGAQHVVLLRKANGIWTVTRRVMTAIA